MSDDKRLVNPHLTDKQRAALAKLDRQGAAERERVAKLPPRDLPDGSLGGPDGKWAEDHAVIKPPAEPEGD